MIDFRYVWYRIRHWRRRRELIKLAEETFKDLPWGSFPDEQ